MPNAILCMPVYLNNVQCLRLTSRSVFHVQQKTTSAFIEHGLLLRVRCHLCSVGCAQVLHLALLAVLHVVSAPSPCPPDSLI